MKKGYNQLAEALEDVEIAFLQLEFAIKMLSYCELGYLEPGIFDTDHVVKLEKENLNFPTGHFSDSDNILKAARVSVSISFGVSALVLDQAYAAAKIRPNPSLESNEEKIRTLVYMVRCAYAHRMAAPRWEVRGSYKHTLGIEVEHENIEVNLPELHNKNFDYDQIGGHHIWFRIRKVAVETLTSRLSNFNRNTSGHN